MDRLLPIGFEIPAAALQSLMSISIIVFIPIYDRILVPLARGITGKQCGITMLQRIGTGLVLSVLCMATAALVERKRLETAREYGPDEKRVPMSVGWLIPQYMIFGIAEALTMVGLQELFYDQVPSGLKSIGLSMYLSIFGVGNFLSSFLISIIQKVTATGEEDGWFCNNLNRAHLYYFYWLLAGLSAVAFLAYLYFAKSFIYMRGTVL